MPSPAPIAEAKNIELEIPQSAGAGHVDAKLWDPGGMEPPRAAIIFVTGIDGGFIEPVDGLYSRTAVGMLEKKVLSIFVTYRNPGELRDSVEDMTAAARLARSKGVKLMALVGWSFGGAVIINTSTRVPEVTTVIGIAPQSRDTEMVQVFRPNSLLLLHAETDENVPFESSQMILDDTPGRVRKKLIPFPSGDHYLSGMEQQVDPEIMKWLTEELRLQ